MPTTASVSSSVMHNAMDTHACGASVQTFYLSRHYTTPQSHRIFSIGRIVFSIDTWHKMLSAESSQKSFLQLNSSGVVHREGLSDFLMHPSP